MFQAIQPDGPQWALRFVPGVERGSRAPRALQSATATELLTDLRSKAGVTAGPSSKAHSRALAAAALARSGVVGVDVEHRTPGRPIQAIARYLMSAPPHSDEAAYRVFTFREAYFKALGDWPERAVLRTAAESNELGYSAGGVNVLHQPVGADFLLTLVWRD